MANKMFQRALKGMAVIALAGLAIIGGNVAALAADEFPSKPVKLIVSFPAGGPTDYLARRVAQEIATVLGQPVVIDNRGGAAGVIATEAAARSDPDGYTILFGTGTAFNVDPHVLKNLPYKVEDFEPVSLVSTAPWILVAGPSAGVKSCKELVTAAKARPGAVNWAHSGIGSGAHLFGVMAATSMGISLQGVPYRGEGLTDLLGGTVQLMPTTLSAGVLQQHRQGKLRILAVGSTERLKALPDLETFADCGYPDVVSSGWFGIFAPAKTPAAITEKLNQAVVKAVASPELQAQLEPSGYVLRSTTRADFAKFVSVESDRIRDIVRAHNIQAQ